MNAHEIIYGVLGKQGTDYWANDCTAQILAALGDAGITLADTRTTNILDGTLDLTGIIAQLQTLRARHATRIEQIDAAIHALRTLTTTGPGTP